ncbi:MAG: hypothetical protein OIN90_09735 [Candidatus Methanoperedens sp.]|nr:hypothetical protein [Candidatus Methanoperedens sp.]CAG0979276.1 hypothetical protein METP1_01680 [Methanosarcinales archaeon]
MDEFLEKLKQTRTGFLSRMRILSILDLIAIFSILYAIFIIINLEYFLNKFLPVASIPIKFIPPVLAIFIAVLLSILLHRRDSKLNVIRIIENKYPDLNEKLRTAYDNRNESNVIVDSLKTIVSESMKVVSPSNLLAKSRIISKVIITIIFIAGMVFISNNPGEYQIPESTLSNITKTFPGQENNTGMIDITGRPENSEAIGSNGSGDIFGKPRIASIEGKNIDLTLYSGVDTGFDVRDTSQTGNQFIKSAAFPVDIVGSNVSDGGYSMLMKKTETEKMLINKYAVERSKI